MGSIIMKIKIVIINLKRSTDRRQRITEQLKACNIPYEFLEATDSDNIDDEWIENNIAQYLKDIYYNKKHHSVNKNALACADSHRRAQKLAANYEDGYTVILEDDVELANNFQNKIKSIVRVMKNNHLHIAFTGYHIFNGKISKHHNLKLNKKLSRLNFYKYPTDGKIAGAYSYIVDNIGANSLVKENIPKIQDTADTFYINEKNINDSTILLYPKLATTGYFDSTIGYKKNNTSLLKNLKDTIFLLSRKNRILLNLLKLYKERQW